MLLSPRKLKNTVVVFDLDDTLYKEFDYQTSGYKEVVRWLEKVYKVSLQNILYELLSRGSSDILKELCVSAGISENVKTTLLWIYRLHYPKIQLSKKVEKLIVDMDRNSAGVVILTDGRSITQSLKLQALGLSRFPAYISEDYEDQKPSPYRFKKVMQDYPEKSYIYIGDNPKKDFIAPNRLGWLTLGVIGNSKNIHSQDLGGLSKEYHPSIWIKNLGNLRKEIIK